MSLRKMDLFAKYRRTALCFLLPIFIFVTCFLTLEAKLPDLTPAKTQHKIKEIMAGHATKKELTPELVKRILQNFISDLDPAKTYFIESDIQIWQEPSDELVQKVLGELHVGTYTVFEDIFNAMAKAIIQRRALENEIDLKNLPKGVRAKEFKDLKWTHSKQELLDRLIRIRALQTETASKLNEELVEISLKRIAKRQLKYEEEILTTDQVQRQRRILSDVLKACASSLDSHTNYLTPDEASQFLIGVQQRLLGIGAQLRDDLNGFTVTKLIEGGPAALSKDLKVKDRIIAVNGEPVVGMDIVDAVDLIRGEEGTLVTLTVIRMIGDEKDKKEETLKVNLKRAAVVLKETRYDTNYIPYGDGVIAYLRLHSFYQDPDTSSTEDISNALKKLKDDHVVKGVILDLRFNTGGILAQAVNLTGLFITKGVVVSIKDEMGQIQHLREIDPTTLWDGPLFVLINRVSASASEIVAQALQDYGRAIVIGDDRSFGKGSFQTFTLGATHANEPINPEGEYKVTRGRYYTVSGKTPQLVGVHSDIVVPGPLSEAEIGEQFSKFPLENDKIPPSYDDDLADIPLLHRDRIRILYKYNMQKQLHTYDGFLQVLKANSAARIANNKNYQHMLQEIKKEDEEAVEEEHPENYGRTDLQLNEAYEVMRDLLYLQKK